MQWPFPKGVTKMIINNLPELYRRILRCVCRDWSKMIKVDKSVKYRPINVCGVLVGNDNASLLEWFIEDIKFFKYEDVPKEDIYESVSVNRLRMCVEKYGYEIKDMKVITELPDNEKSIPMLEFLHPIIISTFENRTIAFIIAAQDKKEHVVQWLIEHNVITEGLLLRIERDAFGSLNTKRITNEYQLDMFVCCLAKWFELSPRFIKRILSVIWEQSYESEVLRIILCTGVWKSRICKEISPYLHKEYQHICKCNAKSKRKKLKV